MRVLLAAMRCEKGAWTANLAAHLRVLSEAAGAGCHLAVFPEMSLTGSVDPRRRAQHLLGLDADAVGALVNATQEQAVAAVFGVAERGHDEAYITQVYACNGRITGVYRKRHLGEDEDGYTPGRRGGVFRCGAMRFGIAICAEGGVDYPFDEAAAAGAQLVLFCAAPGLYGRRVDEAGWREGHTWWEGVGLAQARRHAERAGLWVALATQAGATVDEDFPGLAAVVSPDGAVVARLPDWREATLVADLQLSVDASPV